MLRGGISLALVLLWLLTGTAGTGATEQGGIQLAANVTGGQQREATLAAQLRQNQAREKDLDRQLDAAEQQAASQAAQLADLDSRIQSREAQVETERQQLAQLARAIYMQPESLPLAVMEADGLGRFLTWQTDLESAAERARSTKASIQRDEAQLRSDRARLAAAEADQRSLAARLTSQRAQLQASIAAQQRTLAQLQAALAAPPPAQPQQPQRSAIQRQLAVARQETAMAQSRTATTPPAGGGVGVAMQVSTPACGGPVDGFPCGQCTWWAAMNHPVNWRGDAWQWLGAAIAAGHRTSSQAQVGSIAVYGPGGNYSSFGHVAIVTAVHGGTFTVTEMNYLGEGVVDQRESSYAGVLGFIL
jgi:surface antigen